MSAGASTVSYSTAGAGVVTFDDDVEEQARAFELEAGFALDTLEERRDELKRFLRKLLCEHQVKCGFG